MGEYSKSTNENMVTIIERADMFGRKWFMLFAMSILLLTFGCDSKIEILNGENQVRQYLLDEEGIEDKNIVRIFNIEEDYFLFLAIAKCNFWQLKIQFSSTHLFYFINEFVIR